VSPGTGVNFTRPFAADVEPEAEPDVLLLFPEVADEYLLQPAGTFWPFRRASSQMLFPTMSLMMR
jgi:hypothetical protein